MIKVYEHGTNKQIAEVAAKDFNKWCDQNGYLPHSKRGTGWVVIK